MEVHSENNMYFHPNKYEKPLTPADLADIEEAELHFLLKKSKILDRAWYVFNIIAKHFNLKIIKNFKYEIFDLNEYDWDQNKNELISFHFIRPFINPGVIKVFVDKKEVELVDRWGSVYFPSKWLYCDFEAELVESVNLQKNMEEKIKLVLKAKKKIYQIKSRIIARLKKTMTPEEIQIVFGKEIKDEN